MRATPFAAVALALGGCGLGEAEPTEPDAAPPPPPLECPRRPVAVGEHPYAITQPPPGRTLTATAGWMGKVYFAYGDVDAGTAPIQLAAYDPDTGDWEEHLLLDTPAIGRFRQADGRLWVPVSAPGAAAPELAMASPAHVWTPIELGTPSRVFDLAERRTDDLFVIGAERLGIAPEPVPSRSVTWRSAANGPWTSFLTSAPTYDPMAFESGHAAALSNVFYTATAGPVWAYNGADWDYGPDLAGFAHPVTFGDRIVFQAFNTLWQFDGNTVRTTGIALGDVAGLYEARDEHLVVVTSDRRVLATRDLDEWVCVGTAPVGVTSIGLLDRTVWFGGQDALIHVHDGTAW